MQQNRLTRMRWRSGRALGVLLALFLAYAQPALAGGRVTKGSKSPADLYQAYCSVCHGEKGDGQSRARNSLRPPPIDFTQPGVAQMLSRERMILAVKEGRPGTAMVSWKTQLTEPQMAEIVDYIRTTFMNAGPAPAPAKSAATPAPTQVAADVALPDGLKGDSKLGQALFDNNCTACHGKSGQGNGPRAYFINPKPRDLTSAESRQIFTRPMLYASISAGKRGTEMPAWNKVLSPQEIAHLSEYVYQKFVRTAPAQQAKLK